jgi:DNA polymerase-3 subunit delta'
MTTDPFSNSIDFAASTLLVGADSSWMSVKNALKASVHLSDWWENDLEKPLTIKEVRELHHFAEHTPVGETKILAIYHADLLKAEAANALLKLLEEPPAYLKIVLFAESKRLLPTLISRLRVILLDSKGVSSSEFAQWRQLLEGYSLDSSKSRKRVQEILYFMPLMHNGIQQGVVREAFSSNN